MPSSHPSSACATHGSVVDSTLPECRGYNVDAICSNSEQNGSGNDTSTTAKPEETSNSSVSQTEYSASRLAAFLEDDDDSQVLHPHTSTEASIRSHTSRMAACLDDFEATMKKG
ncbi:uncharacterized protein K444DRAFT_628017 [Hyaloscypha bicolor E]|uniref:Uncharacterized protein n=1 Tax=Hyaloscypha bicolor E TaxID=1095630 RepID=A0A2J6TG46_9HELO|nr:uncharacterized protein K444DRAFT_628017 [Hyaloscypha bicolor E]PMD61989.1 hypothetical protein K444DRAFT_628017 [Hyaloscypha bicolor E]